MQMGRFAVAGEFSRRLLGSSDGFLPSGKFLALIIVDGKRPVQMEEVSGHDGGTQNATLRSYALFTTRCFEWPSLRKAGSSVACIITDAPANVSNWQVRNDHVG